MTDTIKAISKNPDLMQTLINDLTPSLDEVMDMYEAYRSGGGAEDFTTWNGKFVSDYIDRKLSVQLDTPETSTPPKSPSKAVKPSKAKQADKPDKALAKPVQTPAKSDKAPKTGNVETSLTPAEKSKRETLLKVVTDTVRKETSNIASSYMRIGYRLWVVKERKLYLAADLKNVYEYAETAFGFKTSSTKNFIAICEHFSCKDKDGNCTDKIDPALMMFGFSQLSEMLPLSDEQLANVKPEMTIKDIRSLKSQTSGSDDEKSDPDTEDGEPEKPTKTVCFDGTLTAQTWDRVLEKLEKSCTGKHIQITIVE